MLIKSDEGHKGDLEQKCPSFVTSFIANLELMPSHFIPSCKRSVLKKEISTTLACSLIHFIAATVYVSAHILLPQTMYTVFFVSKMTGNVCFCNMLRRDVCSYKRVLIVH